MPPVAEAAVLDALKSVTDPDLGRDIVSLGFVKDLTVDDDRVSFTIELTTPACPVKDENHRPGERRFLASRTSSLLVLGKVVSARRPLRSISLSRLPGMAEKLA
jgi:hypothetical protein